MKNQVSGKSGLTTRWEVRRRLNRYPSKRWGHTAVIFNNKLLIYGGKTGRMKEPLYCINCQTYECDIIGNGGMPKSRESHSFSLIGDKIYIWGGCQGEQVLDDCFRLSLTQNNDYWQPIAQFPKIKPRESHCSIVLKDKFILIYGGSGPNEEIYDDFYVFSFENSIWFEVKNVIGNVQGKVGATIDIIGDTIYLFGGEKNNQNQYSNEISKLSFSHYQFENRQNPPILTAKSINVVGVKPLPRSTHSSVVYKNRYILVLGGQGPCQQNITKQVFFNDIWNFDTINQQWQQIFVKNNNLFKPRSSFTANMYKNRILIFGGMITPNKISDELLVLWLDESPKVQSVQCNLCKFYFTPSIQPQQIPIPKLLPSQTYFKLSLKTFYKLSTLIKHPLQGIGMITDSFKRIGCTKLTFNFLKNNCLLIKGTNCNINKNQFSTIISNFELEDYHYQDIDNRLTAVLSQRIRQDLINYFSGNVKFGCARLGKSIFFANKTNSEINISLITQEILIKICLDRDTLQFEQQSQKNQYLIMRQTLEKYIQLQQLMYEQQKDKRTDNQFIILIMSLDSYFDSFMPIQNHFTLNQYPHHSNSTDNEIFRFLKHYFLKTQNMVVKINQKPVYFQSLESQLESCPIFEIEKINSFSQVKLQMDETNAGIFYYYNDKAVGKYTKFPTSSIRGYIKLNKNHRLNLMGTKLQQKQQIDDEIRYLIEQYRTESKKRRSTIPIVDLVNDQN